MKRHKPLPKRRATKRRSGRVHWPEYLEAVRGLPCYACGCSPRSDPDHLGKHPYGRKASDDTAVPLDRMCHDLRQRGHIFDGLKWVFVGGKSSAMAAWCDAAIAATRAIVLPLLGRKADDE